MPKKRRRILRALEAFRRDGRRFGPRHRIPTGAAEAFENVVSQDDNHIEAKVECQGLPVSIHFRCDTAKGFVIVRITDDSGRDRTSEFLTDPRVAKTVESIRLRLRASHAPGWFML